MLYAVKCHWPGVTQAGLAQVAERATRAAATARLSPRHSSTMAAPSHQACHPGQPTHGQAGDAALTHPATPGAYQAFMKRCRPQNQTGAVTQWSRQAARSTAATSRTVKD